ncbi:hypothetical protein GGE45_003914 [Rhizobium aethiopicum]|uniref:VirC2 family conjugal transfer protein n=1 Tax=Rhizobium aethiopicum TaxID=1138170 RepID=UPI0016148ACA|nr:VirC2 family conjugal transfer protein [Rhizobium aethiopicum]MBB4581566.1 hypothetical protein [Rhizobium aethiopicum]
MGIRKPSVSVSEAKRLAKSRTDGSPLRTPLAAAESAPRASSPAPAPVQVLAQAPEPDLGSAAVKAEREPPPATAAFKRTPADGVFPEAQQPEPKLQVFLSAPLPASGISRSYDALSRQYPQTRALQMVLRRALDDYEIRLDNGSHVTAPTDYAIGGSGALTIVQTSRMIPVRLIEAARKHFDPLGFESTRAFGRKLACAALASFFEAEGKQKR